MKTYFALILFFYHISFVYGNNKINTNLILNDTINIDSIKTTYLDEVFFSVPFHNQQIENIISVKRVNFNDNKLLNKVNISDILIDVPGVNFLKVGPHISKPVIRGLSTNRVVVYTNGIRLENQQWGYEHGLGLNQTGISSVEIIKGPSSLLYGSDAIGGVIYINPEKFLTEEKFSLDFGSYFNSNTTGTLNNLGLKLSGKNLNFLVRGTLLDHNNFKTGKEEVENSGLNEKDLKVGLGFKNSILNSDFRFHKTGSNFQLQIPHEEHEEEEHEEEEHEEEGPYQKVNNTIFGFKNEFFVSENSTLELNLGYIRHNREEFGHHEEEEHEEEEHEEEEHEEEAALVMLLETKSLNFKYFWTRSDKFEIVAGGQYLSQKNKNFGNEILIPDSKMNDLGFYLSSHLHIKKLDLMLGLRTDSRIIEVNSKKYDYSTFIGSSGIKYNLNFSTLRLNLSSGYRSPNLSELFSNGVHHGTSQYEKGNLNLKEEKNIQFDISYDYNKNWLRFGIDGFYNRVNNYIFLSPSGTSIDDYPLFEYSQSNAMLYGGELFFEISPTSAKWLESKTYLDYVRGKLVNGNNLPLIPPLRLQQNFNFKYDDKNGFLLKINLTDNQNKVANFETETKKYVIFDFGYEHNFILFNNELNISLEVNNILNEQYYNHLSRLKNIGIQEMGRNFSFGMTYKIQ